MSVSEVRYLPKRVYMSCNLFAASKKRGIEPAVNDAIDTLQTAVKPVSHVVRKGQTLSQIADLYGTDYQSIAQANNISNPNNIYVGQRLNIPDAKQMPIPSKKLKPKPTTKKTIPDETKIDSKGVGCDKCYCNRDFTVDEMKKLINTSSLFSWKNCPLPKNEKNYETLTKELNKTMKTYNINTCLQKAHFLAQCAHESAGFQTTVEGNGYKAPYAPYYGRGLIQLTHGLSNYKKYSNFKGIDFVKDPNLIAKKLSLSCDVSGWYWRHGSVWGDLNIYADKDDLLRISLGVNGGMNGYSDRKSKVKRNIQIMKIKINCKNLKLMKPIGIYKYSTSEAKNKSWARKHKRMLEKYDD